MEAPKKIRIGDLLVQNQIITHDQLMQVLAEQKITGKKLGQSLIDLKFITEDDLLNFLSRQMQIPLIDISHYKRDDKIATILSENIARRFRVLLLENNEHDVLIAMSDPTDLSSLDELTRIFNKRIRQALVKESDLLTVIDQCYRNTDEISALAEQLDDELAENDFDFGSLNTSNEISEAPVVKLLESIFEDAVLMSASDIHIEPDEKILRIRQRIDGVLHEQIINEVKIISALIVRLKLMAGLNISEKRLPQDGRFSIRVKGRSLDIRMSTLPVTHGESVVMRLLDNSTDILNLDTLGMPEDLLARLRVHIRSPHGLLLVTGPTGSGKTTTLYSALSEVNTPETKIITAEDPVEYSIPRINQTEINTKIGLSFASVLRSALRQDPDIILVGEMRDTETAEIAIRASITGHLVFSTLHTNNAVETATRLLDMGVKGYILASALKLIIAQRLIRRICPKCITEVTLDEAQQIWLESNFKHSENITFKRGLGCQHCNSTGYKGRIGVYELLELNHDTLDALRRNSSSEFVIAAKNTKNFIPLAERALDYAREGITTLDEVIKITGSIS
ncbi:MAG: Flp pilus assembly complex ATPase component TadA [Piscirickettsiaceae bacterium]|nr:Flp pilus assembly complex ATPase component TadA [Piscirickettsiaceae bacterium]